MSVIRPPKVALIAGPTASGKSAMAMALAKLLMAQGREALIVNADASQVYADIPILSAAPDAADRAAVPHALVGHVDAADAVNAARWAAEARDVLADAHGRGAIPILVGGTGLYIQTLLRGIAPVPPIDEGIRQSVRSLPFETLRRMIEVHDPDAHVRLDRGDTNRLSRALEVVLSTGTPLHVWQQRRSGGIGEAIDLSPLLLLPPREWLRARCDQRFDAMLAAGALDEVRRLVARGLAPDLPAMRAIGVPELAAALEAGASDAAIDAARKAAHIATRQYAKRQYTFFRGQFPDDWPRETRELNDSIVNENVIKLRQTLLTD